MMTSWWHMTNAFWCEFESPRIYTVTSSPFAQLYPVPVATGTFSVSHAAIKDSVSYCVRVIAMLCDAEWTTPKALIRRYHDWDIP